MRDGYVAAIKNILQYSGIHGWLRPGEALDGRLLQIATEGFFEGPVKKQLSGIKVVEKGGVVSLVVEEADWVFAKSTEKLRRKKGGTWTRWPGSLNQTLEPHIIASQDMAKPRFISR